MGPEPEQLVMGDQQVSESGDNDHLEKQDNYIIAYTDSFRHQND